MKKIGFFIIFYLILAVGPVYAQDPTPTPGSGGGGIEVPQDALPYNFEPYEYDQGASPVANLDLFDDPFFINTLGSTTLTLFTLFDVLNTLAIFVVLLLALWVLWKVYKFVTTSTPEGTVDLSFYEPMGNDEPAEYVQERRYFSNPYKVYTQRFIKKK